MTPLLKSEARRYTRFSLDFFLKNCLGTAPSQRLLWGGMNARVDNPPLVDYSQSEREASEGDGEGRAGYEEKRQWS